MSLLRRPKRMIVWNFGVLVALSFAQSAFAVPELPKVLKADPPKVEKNPPWMLGTFMDLSRRDPERLLRISEKLFAVDRMSKSSREPALAFEWQHRLAAVNALSDLFDPSHQITKETKVRARKIIEQAVMQDPSLLVRDGAVESLRRLFRMDNNEAKHFAPTLEKAFLDRKNTLDGEGFFIRETILVAMREGLLSPSKRVKNSALADANPAVRNRLNLWKTGSYDTIPTR